MDRAKIAGLCISFPFSSSSGSLRLLLIRLVAGANFCTIDLCIYGCYEGGTASISYEFPSHVISSLLGLQRAKTNKTQYHHSKAIMDYKFDDSVVNYL